MTAGQNTDRRSTGEGRVHGKGEQQSCRGNGLAEVSVTVGMVQ